jgi:hypothetical protein
MIRFKWSSLEQTVASGDVQNPTFRKLRVHHDSNHCHYYVGGVSLRNVGFYKSPDTAVFPRNLHSVLSPWKFQDIYGSICFALTKTPIKVFQETGNANNTCWSDNLHLRSLYDKHTRGKMCNVCVNSALTSWFSTSTSASLCNKRKVIPAPNEAPRHQDVNGSMRISTLDISEELHAAAAFSPLPTR